MKAATSRGRKREPKTIGHIKPLSVGAKLDPRDGNSYTLFILLQMINGRIEPSNMSHISKRDCFPIIDWSATQWQNETHFL